MKILALILMVVGGGAIVTSLMGVRVDYFQWMNQWGVMFGWVIRIGMLLFGTMLWGFAGGSR